MRSVLSVSLTLIFCLFAAVASAGPITGNPAADGWTAQGNSLAIGTYIRGGGGFNYNVYTTSFTLEAGSPLLGGGWQVGDTILAMGGVIVDNASGNLTSSVRIVSKFGNSPTAWQASTTASPNGDGLGSTSSGHGGNGAVLLGTVVGDVNAADEGTIKTSSDANIYNPAEISITNSVGKYIYTLDGSDLLSTWEVFLNITMLDELDGTADGLYNASLDLPAPGDRINQALQRSSNATLFTDALGVLPALQQQPGDTEVPEPASLALWTLVGVAGLTARARRRRRG